MLGLKFPAAVREWYSAVDGRHILEKYSNQDHALLPAEFELVTIGSVPLVKFMIENQWVCWWGFAADESGDPPVFVCLDHAPPDNLFQYSASFSEFTYARVFDHDHMWDENLYSMDIYEPLSRSDLGYLQSKFIAEPGSGGWPVVTTCRFSSPLGRITIWAGDDQADWIMSAKSAEDLKALKEQVAHLWREL